MHTLLRTLAPAADDATIEARYERLKHVTHITLMIVILGWAVLPLLPGDLFSTSTSFRAFRATGAPEWLWSLLFAIFTGMGLVGLVWWRNLDVRIISIALLATAHGLVSAFLLGSAVLSPGIVAYAAWAFLGYYLMVVTIRDRRVV